MSEEADAGVIYILTNAFRVYAVYHVMKPLQDKFIATVKDDRHFEYCGITYSLVNSGYCEYELNLAVSLQLLDERKEALL